MNRPRLLLCSALAVSATLPVSAADEPQHHLAPWRFQQDVSVSAAGLTEVRLPPDTLEAALSDLADLRVVDPEGKELPYFRPAPPSAVESTALPGSFQPTLQPGLTQLLIEVPAHVTVAGVTLGTPATTLLKAVALETSGDGERWTPVAQGLPIFRQDGIENLRVNFPPTTARFLRLGIDDRRSAAVPFTASTLHVPGAAQPEEPGAVVLADRTEMRGQSRIELQFAAAHLRLSSIGIEADEPVFMRRVTLQASVVEPGSGEAHEVTLATGTVFRIAVDGAPPQARLDLPLRVVAPVRNLVLLIENGDSPPLSISSVRASSHPVPVRFLARQPGRHTLLTGNPSAKAPHYDLSALGPDLSNAASAPAATGPLGPNPRHVAAVALPEIPTHGAPQDMAQWAFRKSVSLSRPGLQQLELDPAVLGRSGLRAADVRLMDGSWQVPYLLERTSILRALTPAVRPAPDPKRPRLSRWEINLPSAGLPARALHCTSNAALFDRPLQLVEEVTDSFGQTVRRPLASTTWSQSARPEKPASFSLALTTPPVTSRWLLELDNGDNAPIGLDGFEVTYPAIRLLFRTDSADPLVLYYGNPTATSPVYDLPLAAGPLLNARKSTATAGPEEPTSGTRGPSPIAGRAGIVFWSALALVVITLLLLVARLLPKGESTTG